MEEVYCASQQENQWIDLARAGHLFAFNQLVLMNQDIAFRTAKWIVRDPACAEDIVQTVFLTAYRRFDSLQGIHFRAWLLKMIRNACVDELRRRKRHPWLSLSPMNGDGEEVELGKSLTNAKHTLEETIIQQETWEWLEQRMRRLPEPMREVMILVDIESLNYAEAAKILSIPIGTVKSRLGRARARMRDILKEAISGEMRVT